MSSSPRAAILVEGTSDMVAIEALAERRGVDTDAAGITIVPMGGAHAVGRFLDLFVPQGLRLAGLCDAGEADDFARELERVGLGQNVTRTSMEEIGFFVCVEDLEDELIRAHGAAVVEQVIETEGTSARSARSSSSPSGESAPSRSSSGASWAAAGAGRSAMRGCSSMHSTWS